MTVEIKEEKEKNNRRTRETHTTRSNMPGLQRTITSTTTTTNTTTTITTAWRRQGKFIVGQPGLSYSPPTGTRVWRSRGTHLCGIYDNAPVCCIFVQSRHVMMGAWGGGEWAEIYLEKNVTHTIVSNSTSSASAVIQIITTHSTNKCATLAEKQK